MADLRVILLEDISNLGRAGDIVSVTEGYARNALFPAGRAALATDQVRRKVEASKAKQKKLQKERLQQLQETANILENTELILIGRIKDGNELYAGFSKKQLAQELNAKAHLSVKPSDLTIDAPIKQTGSYPMVVALSPEVEFTMTVTVQADPSSLPKHHEEE